MATYDLSKSEKVLLIVTVFVVFISIVLSLCIGLVLPPNFVNTNYTLNGLKSYCQCNTPAVVQRRSSIHDERFLNDWIFKANQDPELLQYNPYLVSLHTNVDSNSVKKFACSGAIVLEDWILVGRDCVTDDGEWLDLQVRSRSAFWTIGGSLHKVTQFAYLEKKGPVVLQVSPEFTFGYYANQVKLSDKPVSWSRAIIANWIVPNVNKDSTYLTETWHNGWNASSGHQGRGDIRQTISCNLDMVLSGALVSYGNELIAFRVGLCGSKHIFIDFQNGPYAKWIRQLVADKEPQIFTKFSAAYNITRIYCSSFFNRPKFEFPLTLLQASITTEYQEPFDDNAAWNTSNTEVNLLYTNTPIDYDDLYNN